VRVLFVSRERHRLPLDESQRRKWDAIAGEVDTHVLAAAVDGSTTEDGTFVLAPPLTPRALDGIAFYAALPLRATRELRRLDPDVVLVQGVHETALVLLARRLARSRARVVLDLHGDWRTATRLYGSRARELLNPVADHAAALAIRHADAIRALSPTTRRLVEAEGREPAAVFPAYVDLAAFTASPPAPLPERPSAVFVGVLERYKAFDTLAVAWRLAAPRLPGAQLRLIGTGTLSRVAGELVRELPEQTAWTPRVPQAEVAAALDGATVLLLPSRSEGLPRIAIEALCRGRPIIGGRGGGTPDIVHDGVNGLLVDPEDAGELADAIVRVLDDRGLAERLAAGARESAPTWQATPEEYARRLGDLLRAAASA
jgi:glycosyltransferase involved in cell wall biosynthesis